MAKEKKDKSKYDEPVKVEMPDGFTFDDFVGAVANADPEKVEREIRQKMYETYKARVEATDDPKELSRICYDLSRDIKKQSKKADEIKERVIHDLEILATRFSGPLDGIARNRLLILLERFFVDLYYKPWFDK